MKNCFKSSTCILLAVFSFTIAQAQLGVDVHYGEGIKDLLERHVTINRSQQYIPNGYRVQILATTDRMKLQDARRDFERNYAQRYALNWIHDKPWYKLRVGAFLTQMDAQRTLHILKENYPGAYLTEAKDIEPLELINNW